MKYLPYVLPVILACILGYAIQEGWSVTKTLPFLIGIAIFATAGYYVLTRASGKS